MVYGCCNGNDQKFVALKRKYGGLDEKCRFSDNGELDVRYSKEAKEMNK